MKIRLDKLDILFSEFIRRRAIKETGGCEKCLDPRYDILKENGDTLPAWKQLQCAHLLGRWKGSIRWDEENAIGACGGCHMTLDKDHLGREDFIMRHLGQDRYDLLKARARITYPKSDKVIIELYLKEKIHELEGG